MDNINVLLIEEESYDKELINQTLSKLDYISLVGEATDGEEAEYFIRETYPNVIIIGSNLKQDRYKLSQSISSQYIDIAIIMIEEELKEDTMYKTLSSGAKDVIISPFNSSKLVDSIYRAWQLVKDQGPVERDKGARPRRRGQKGNLITVFSTKGGVGKTFVSTNLAVSLSKLKDKSVCLVDLDLDFGNTVLALNLVPRFTILDLVDDIKNIDQDVIESYLIPHVSGIKVLPANAKPQINEFIGADHVDIILKALQGAFDYVVVDMPARFYGPVNPAFQISDILLMVTTPELSAVRNVKAAIQTLQDLNFPKSKIKVLLNKADASKQIKPKDLENTLNQKIYEKINFDSKLAILSLNNGIPVTISKPRSSISKSFRNLSKKINIELRGTDDK